MRKKARTYSKEKAVKSIARERVGTPPPSRALEERQLRSKPKHKKKLEVADE